MASVCNGFYCKRKSTLDVVLSACNVLYWWFLNYKQLGIALFSWKILTFSTVCSQFMNSNSHLRDTYWKRIVKPQTDVSTKNVCISTLHSKLASILGLLAFGRRWRKLHFLPEVCNRRTKQQLIGGVYAMWVVRKDESGQGTGLLCLSCAFLICCWHQKNVCSQLCFAFTFT